MAREDGAAGDGGRVRPFRLSVPQAVLDDLDGRLRNTRWPELPPGTAWDAGTDVDHLRRLVEHWLTRYDWRAHEARINELPQFEAKVDGLRVHFVHARAGRPGAIPLLALHGWPGTFLEMSRLLPLLTGADGASSAGPVFDVVVPSLIGYGFSDPPAAPGFGYRAMAGVMNRLMTDVLGYPRFGLHCTDVGAFVSWWLGLDTPANAIGIHTLEPGPPGRVPDPSGVTGPDEAAALERMAHWELHEGAYAHLQRTKPQTLSFALADSPVALAAWLAEKYRTWSDCDGDLDRRYPPDELLTILMVYWAGGRAPSSVRSYYERFHVDPPPRPGERLTVPTGVALTPDRPGKPPRHHPRSVVERAHRVEHWVELPRGGHFASYEEPELVAGSIRTFFDGRS